MKRGGGPTTMCGISRKKMFDYKGPGSLLEGGRDEQRNAEKGVS